jgi:hypothetical protein
VNASDQDRVMARTSAAQPDQSDAVIRANTGRVWDDWCRAIDAWPGHHDGHAAVAAWLVTEHGLSGWWAQSVTVGWERLSGRRERHQVADGTYTANRSATLRIDVDRLADELRDPTVLEQLFPGLSPSLRSRPGSRSVRIGLCEGIALVSIDRRDDERATVTVSHEKLPSSDAVGRWKAYWGEWLDALGANPRRPAPLATRDGHGRGPTT